MTENGPTIYDGSRMVIEAFSNQLLKNSSRGTPLFISVQPWSKCYRKADTAKRGPDFDYLLQVWARNINF